MPTSTQRLLTDATGQSILSAINAIATATQEMVTSASFFDYDIIIQMNEWSVSAPYTYVWSNSAVTESCIVDVKYRNGIREGLTGDLNFTKGNGTITFVISQPAIGPIPLTVRIIDAAVGAIYPIPASLVAVSNSTLDLVLNTKADKEDTVLTTTLSRGRKPNSTVGEGSFTFGYNVEASGIYSNAKGSGTIASGSYSNAKGYGTTASGWSSNAEGYVTIAGGDNVHAEGYNTAMYAPEGHVQGVYNAIQEIPDEWEEPAPGIGSLGGHISSSGSSVDYAVNDLVCYNNKIFRCITAHTCDANNNYPPEGDESSSTYWEFVENVLYDVVGNGDYTRSNAYALDHFGNGYFNGDVRINCNADSSGGTSINNIISKSMLKDISKNGTTNYVTSFDWFLPGMYGRCYLDASISPIGTLINGNFIVSGMDGAFKTIIFGISTNNTIYIMQVHNNTARGWKRLDQDYYGTCDTAAGTQEKQVTCVGFPTTLVTGTRITVKFTNAQTYNGQPTLKIESLTAKNINRSASIAAGKNEWNSGQVLTFVYDGTNWIIIDGQMASGDFPGNVKIVDGYNPTTPYTKTDGIAVSQKAVYDAYHAINDRFAVVTGTTGTTVGSDIKVASYPTGFSSSNCVCIGSACKNSNGNWYGYPANKVHTDLAGLYANVQSGFTGQSIKIILYKFA